jgi:TonB family protein
VASAPSASRSPPAAPSAAGGAHKGSQPAADITAITTRDDFLLELGQTLGGQAAVRPVESLDAALASMASGKRAQVLVIDARELADVRAAVDAARTAVPRAVVVVFAAAPAAKQLGTALKGRKVYAVLPLPLDVRKTQAALERAIADAVAAKAAVRAAPAPQAEPGSAPLRPESAPGQQAVERRAAKKPRILLIALAAAAAALAAGAAGFFLYGNGAAPSATAPAAATPAATTPPAANAVIAPAADTSIVQGKVDELLEKARLAMHERRFTEPAGNNALLYYRSAAAADAGNGEARDGLQRVAGVLAGRFDDAMSGGRLEEAAQTLANFRTAVPDDARGAAFEARLYSVEVSRALADGNLDRAAALVRQAQQSAAVPAEQLAKWRADITRRQEEARVQHLAGLIEDSIHDGRLTDADDSAKVYLQQLAAAAPANPNTQRLNHELTGVYLHKARDAALAKNSADEERWLGEARALGLTPAEFSAFQKDLASAQQKAAQAESERLVQLARERLREGRLTDPAQDSAAWYLTQLQAGDAGNAGLTDTGHELAGKLLVRARAAILAGKPGDADLAEARRWGADPKELAAVQQLTAPAGKGAALDPAALAASLKLLKAPSPEYPPSAVTQHLSGSVTLQFTVDTHGETRDIHVVEATPPQVFDRAAINAVKHWRYAPMLVDGTAVEVPTKARIHFEQPK